MRLLVLATALLTLSGCVRDDVVQVQVPVASEPTPGSRIVVVYERGTKGWTPAMVEPLLPVVEQSHVEPPPPAPEHHDTCKIFVLPAFTPTPAVPKVGKLGEDDIDPILYAYIGQLRGYITAMKQDIRSKHTDYLKSCNPSY